MNSSSPFRGRVLMVLSAVAFSVMGLAAKAVPPPVGSSEKVFFRSLVGALLILAFIRVRKGREGRPVNYRGLVVRGTVGAAALLAFFYSIDAVGLTRATLYYFTYPAWAAVLAWFDRQERPRPAVLGWLVVAMAGVGITLMPPDGASGNVLGLELGTGDVVGLVGGLLSGMAVTSVRRLHRTDTSTWIVLAFTVGSTVISAPCMLATYVAPTGKGWLLMAAVGVLAVAAQSLMTAGYRHVKTVEGALYGLSIVPISAVLGMLVLGETLSLQFWIGSLLVLAAAAGSSLHGIGKKPAAVPAPSPARRPAATGIAPLRVPVARKP